jgi:hypothetical protein
MENQTIIGRFSTGTLASIPRYSEWTEIVKHVASLPVAQQIEILCLLETIQLDAVRAIEYRHHESVDFTYLVLLDRSSLSEFQKEMQKMGILTSIDRVRLGRKLRL